MPPRSKEVNGVTRRAALHAWLFEIQLRLLPIVLPLAIVLVIIGGVLSLGALSQIKQVKKNTTQAQRTADKLRAAQKRSCRRDRVLRLRINVQGKTLRKFLGAAEATRLHAGTPMDLKAAKAYRELRRSITIVNVPSCGTKRRGKVK